MSISGTSMATLTSVAWRASFLMWPRRLVQRIITETTTTLVTV